VNGSQTAGPSRNGSTSGKWTYTGATQVTATNTMNGSNGKVFLTPLLPANRKIVKVGGPNSSGVSYTSDSHEAEDSFGVQGPIQDPQGALTNTQYAGQYRIEIIPNTPSLYDTFLNVVEATDANIASATPTVMVSGANMVGARVGDRIAVFNNQEGILGSGDFIIDSAGTYKILISDLNPSTNYSIAIGSNSQSVTTTTAGTVYLSATVAANTKVSLFTTSQVPPPNPTLVSGDLNNDCIVNSLDWSIMNSKWFTSDATVDLNHDGIVNTLDWSIMNANWFKSC
jgi:hypothetical protein